MATKTNVTAELNLCDIIEFDDSVKTNKVPVCDKLDKPLKLHYYGACEIFLVLSVLSILVQYIQYCDDI